MHTPSSRQSTVVGPTGLPFDDVRAVLSHFPAPDNDLADVVRQRLLASGGEMSMPALTERAAWLAAVTASAAPPLTKVGLALFIADLTGVPPGPEPSLSLMEALGSGCHLASQLCQRAGVGLKVYDLALDVATPDPRREAVMTEQECAATMAFGMEATAGLDAVILSRAGAGGQAAALATLHLLDRDLAQLTASDAASADGAFAEQAASLHAVAAGDPFEVLRRVGGRDLAALVGATMAARSQRQPVLLEGLGGLAAAAVLAKAGQGNLDHCLFADVRPAFISAARRLGMAQTALVDAAGEGAAGLLALAGLQAAVDAMNVAHIIHRARHG